MTSTNAIRVCDTAQYSRESQAYRLGVAKLKQWHMQCAMKRLKVKREKMLAEKKSKGVN